jgi:hypothetical protein
MGTLNTLSAVQIAKFFFNMVYYGILSITSDQYNEVNWIYLYGN